MLNKIGQLELGILVVNLIFNMIKVMLIIISVLIIYSLLMQSIESKQFELAVLQMIGLQKSKVITVILAQSFFYVIPACMVAFATSVLILTKASEWSHREYKININKVPTLSSSIQGIIIGVLIPIFSSILPVRQALKRSIVDSLDNQKSKT